jgi:hypothetical protein
VEYIEKKKVKDSSCIRNGRSLMAYAMFSGKKKKKTDSDIE